MTLERDMQSKNTRIAENKTQDLSDLCRNIIEHSPSPLAATTGEKHIVEYVNLAYCNLVNKKKQNLIGHPFAESGPGIESLIASMDRVYRTGKSETDDGQENSDPHVHHWSYSVWALPNTDGRPVGIVIELSPPSAQISINQQQLAAMNQELMLSAVRQHEVIEEVERLNSALQAEIAERKLAEEDLKKNEELLLETNKELDDFSFTVSHDLQAPLRAIKGFSRMILRDKESQLDRETKRKFTVIQENADQMQRLIEDLLTLARVGRQGLFLRVIDMSALVKKVWKDFETVYPEKPLVLEMTELQPAYGDESLIRQVIVNLLSNAIKF
jgi:signal transduction histidine kinase